MSLNPNGFQSSSLQPTAAPTREGRPQLRPARDFGLPANYRQQTAAATHDLERPEGEPTYWNPARIAAAGKYQYHVYRWAAELIEAAELNSVLDVGCGPGVKLRSLLAPVCADIEGIDQRSAIDAAMKCGAPGKFTEVDLDNPGAIRPWRTFDLIVCADVVEHLIDPDPMLRMILGFCHHETLVLFSTPDRARLHGRACMASEKPEHVREWTHPEFKRLLSSRGYQIVRSRLFPADDAPMRDGMTREWLWRMRLSTTSPHRCQTVLCQPRTRQGSERAVARQAVQSPD